VVIGTFFIGIFDIEVLSPDGIVAVMAVLLGLLCMYAIAGYITALERLERGARILGRLVAQGKLDVSARSSLTIPEEELPEDIDEDGEEEDLSPFKENANLVDDEPEPEEPEEEEPMYEEKEEEPRPRVEYREPQPVASRPPVIHKHTSPAYPVQPYQAQPPVQYVPYPVPTPSAPAPTYLYSTTTPTSPQAPPVQIMALPQDRNAQLVMTTQQPCQNVQTQCPYQKDDKDKDKEREKDKQEELFRALSYRLQDVHARLAWLRQRLENVEDSPVPGAAAGTPAPAGATASATVTAPSGGAPISDSEREQLNMQIRRLESESRMAREEQMRLVERIRTLQNEGLGSAALKADFEAAKREKERLLARQRRLEGDAEKARLELDQTLTKMAEKEQEHRKAIQRLLVRMQEAETEKERLAMELERLRNMKEQQPDFTQEQIQYEQIIREKEQEFENARAEADQLREEIERLSEPRDQDQIPPPPTQIQQDDLTAADMLATGLLERTGLDYQAFITLRDKFILDEVGRLAACPLSRILSTRELDNTVVSILEEMDLSFHTITAVRKKKSQLKDFYRKPRIETMTARIDSQLRLIPGLADDPSLRASLIEVGVARPFYNSLIEHVILETSPPGTKLKVRRPSVNEQIHIAEALELSSQMDHVLSNPLHMATAPPGSEEDRFFDLFYLLPKEYKEKIKNTLVTAYVTARQTAILVSIKNLQLWYAGFYVEPERLADVQHDRDVIEEGVSVLPEKEHETVTTVVGSESEHEH